MIKYIEELNHGDFFNYNSLYYVLTTDFKKNNERLCVSLKDGLYKWFKPEAIVDQINLYSLDESNNITPIKEFKNESSNKN